MEFFLPLKKEMSSTQAFHIMHANIYTPTISHFPDYSLSFASINDTPVTIPGPDICVYSYDYQAWWLKLWNSISDAKNILPKGS